MKKLICASLVAALFLSGCSIRLSNSKISDGGFFRSTDYGQAWEQKVFVRQDKRRAITISDVNPTAIILSPFSQNEIVLPTSANGIYVSTDNGEAWNALPVAPGNYPAFAYDPVNAAILYTATGRTILKSADSGSTWDVVYTDVRNEIITALAVDSYDPSKVFAATNTGTLLKSLNYGNDWSVKYSAMDPVRSIFFQNDDTRVLYLVTANKGIVRSDDNGETWTNLQEAFAEFPGANVMHQVTFSPQAPRVLYAATNYGLLKSSNGGDTWEAIKTLIPFGTVPIQTVAIDPFNSQILYFTVSNLLHKSEDGGATWRTIETIPTSRLITRLIAHPNIPGTLFLGGLKLKK